MRYHLTSQGRTATSRWGLSTQINCHQGHVATYSWGWNGVTLFTASSHDRDSYPHSAADNTRAWVQWTRPLGHDTLWYGTPSVFGTNSRPISSFQWAHRRHTTSWWKFHPIRLRFKIGSWLVKNYWPKRLPWWGALQLLIVLHYFKKVLPLKVILNLRNHSCMNHFLDSWGMVPICKCCSQRCGWYLLWPR